MNTDTFLYGGIALCVFGFSTGNPTLILGGPMVAIPAGLYKLFKR